jgi:hypothetical protein
VAMRDASMDLAPMAIDGVGCARLDGAPGERRIKTETSVQCGTTQRITPVIVFALTLQLGLTSAQAADTVNYSVITNGTKNTKVRSGNFSILSCHS